MRRIILLLLAIFLAASILSCASTGMKRGPSGDLAKAVREFYKLKKNGRFDEVWNYERMSTDENKKRRENSRRVYIRRSAGRVNLKYFEILEIGEEGSGIKGFTPVKVKLVQDWPAMPFPMPEGDRVLIMEDLWEKIDGKWYHVVRGMTKFW